MPELSRRDFIKGVGLVPLAAALPAPVLAKALADTSNSYRFFTPHEAAVVIEATARIIPGPTDDPTEAGHPGAREANVVRYIDTMLAAFSFHPARVYAGGPFSNRAGASRDDMAYFVPVPRIRRLGWQKRLARLHRRYRNGVQQLDSMSSTSLPARSLKGPPAWIRGGLNVNAASIVSMYRMTFASRAPGCPVSVGSSFGPGMIRAVASITTAAWCCVKKR